MRLTHIIAVVLLVCGARMALGQDVGYTVTALGAERDLEQIRLIINASQQKFNDELDEMAKTNPDMAFVDRAPMLTPEDMDHEKFQRLKIKFWYKPGDDGNKSTMVTEYRKISDGELVRREVIQGDEVVFYSVNENWATKRTRKPQHERSAFIRPMTDENVKLYQAKLGPDEPLPDLTLPRFEASKNDNDEGDPGTWVSDQRDDQVQDPRWDNEAKHLVGGAHYAGIQVIDASMEHIGDHAGWEPDEIPDVATAQAATIVPVVAEVTPPASQGCGWTICQTVRDLGIFGTTVVILMLAVSLMMLVWSVYMIFYKQRRQRIYGH